VPDPLPVAPDPGYGGEVADRADPPDLDVEAMSDAALVVAIGRWRSAALAEVFRRHAPAVRALARSVGGTDAVADDVTQEVFVELWRRPERFDTDRGALRTYLTTIAHARAVDLLRSEAARRWREDRNAHLTATAGYDIEHHAWDLAAAERVRAALAGLPEGERRAIELAYFDGYTYREVAAHLDAPEGTIKTRIRTGLRRLRAAVEPDLSASPAPEP
jgi:RNA polymerase sigma-70 factor, ECF subfamily